MSENTYTISSSPIDALMGAALVVGVERDEDDALRVYLGARYNGVYMLLDPGERADAIERLWRGAPGHLWLRPVPPPEALFCDKPTADDTTGGTDG